MGGSQKEKLMLAGRIKKVEKFPDSLMVWSLQLPLRVEQLLQAFILIGRTPIREARFQEIL